MKKKKKLIFKRRVLAKIKEIIVKYQDAATVTEEESNVVEEIDDTDSEEIFNLKILNKSKINLKCCSPKCLDYLDADKLREIYTANLCEVLIKSFNEYCYTKKDSNDFEYEGFLNKLILSPYVRRESLSAFGLKSVEKLLNHFPSYFNDETTEITSESLQGEIYHELIKECIIKQKPYLSTKNPKTNEDCKFYITCPKNVENDIELDNNGSNIKFPIHGQSNLVCNGYPTEIKTIRSFHQKLNLEDILNQIAVYQLLNNKDKPPYAYLLLLSRDTLEVAMFEVSPNNVDRFKYFWNYRLSIHQVQYNRFFAAMEIYITLSQSKDTITTSSTITTTATTSMSTTNTTTIITTSNTTTTTITSNIIDEENHKLNKRNVLCAILEILQPMNKILHEKLQNILNSRNPPFLIEKLCSSIKSNNNIMSNCINALRTIIDTGGITSSSSTRASFESLINDWNVELMKNKLYIIECKYYNEPSNCEKGKYCPFQHEGSD